MDIFRFITAGSVDDGKSTLIGRLLYETGSIPQDKLHAIEQTSKRKGLDFTDLSLLTDGLIAEREQGITIDVAHIYFSTPQRKYIIADTPGHVEYTRNMVTGASTAHGSLILVDARKGIIEQTYRHFSISSLLKIPHVIVCVNKMDLVDYDHERFQAIVMEFRELAARSAFEGHDISQNIYFVPVSALCGDNITTLSEQTPWYEGKPLLELLESIELQKHRKNLPARLPVQYVIRPKTQQYHDYRGFAGRVASGALRVGERVVALPSGQESTIKTIEKYDQTLMEAHAGESVVVTLADEIDLSRGGTLVPVGVQPEQRKETRATLCWLAAEPLASGAMLLLQHGVNRVKAKVTTLHHAVNIQTGAIEPDVRALRLNDIGSVTLRTAQPIAADSFATNPSNGAFILIEERTNNTVGVGVIA